MEGGILRVGQSRALVVKAQNVHDAGERAAALAMFMAEVIGRVGSSSLTYLASSAATLAPSCPRPCSSISLPMLQRTTEGWLRSRRTIACLVHATGRRCGHSRSASCCLPRMSKVSSMTMKPMRSQGCSSSGAGGLWLVRMALQPIS